MLRSFRRLVIYALLLSAAAYATAADATTALKLEGFTLRGDIGGAHTSELHQQRLAHADEQLHEAFSADARFTLVDDADDAELILEPWVYRVSSLVLAVHVELRNTEGREVVARRTVDFRGDNDTGWQRAVSRLLSDWP